MSKVYLARDNKLNRQLAIKEVQKNARDKNNEVVIQSAIAEANILKNLSHVGLAYIVDIIDTARMIYIVAVAAILSLVIGTTGLFMRTATNNADYTNLLQLAGKSTSDTEKENDYISAINIKPIVNDAYLGLIDAYKSDANFTTDEEAQLTKIINKNLTALKATNGYADLAFEMGVGQRE